MTAARVPDGAVILTDRALAVVTYALIMTQRQRAKEGRPPLAEIAALLDIMSAPGQSDSPEDATGDPEEVMSTDQVASFLKCSPRTVRRLAHRLGARQIGGRWVYDAQAVREHHEGTTP